MAPKLTIEYDVIDVLHRTTTSRAKIVALTDILAKDSVKREFGKRYIARIIDRTLDGIDKRSRDFKPYSISYMKSQVFKARRKSSDVNLKLTGDMQANIKVINLTDTGGVIAFGRKKENDKAHGHVFGGGALPVRDFFGLPLKEQETIMRDVIREHQSDTLESRIAFGLSLEASVA